MANSDGFVLVFSFDSLESLNNLHSFVAQIAQQKAEKGDVDSAGNPITVETLAEVFPIVLVGNKSDLVQKTVTQADIDKFLAKYSNANNKIPFFETSAKDNINVKEVFTCLSAKVMQKHALDYFNKNGWNAYVPPQPEEEAAEEDEEEEQSQEEDA